MVFQQVRAILLQLYFRRHGFAELLSMMLDKLCDSWIHNLDPATDFGFQELELFFCGRLKKIGRP